MPPRERESSRRESTHSGGPAAPRNPGTLVGLSEIAAKLGVSRQRVVAIARTASFPAPEDELRSGRVWRAKAVDAWIAKHRPGGGPGADPP